MQADIWLKERQGSTNNIISWQKLIPDNSLSYQYKNPVQLRYQYSDVKGRSLPLLLVSLSKFGQRCLEDRTTTSPPFAPDTVAALTALCTDSTSPEHFDTLFADDLSELNMPSKPILSASVLPESDSGKLHPELSKSTDAKCIIFYQHLHANNWAILVVHLRAGLTNVDGYFIGNVVPLDLDPIVHRLTNFLKQCGRKSTIVWTPLVHVSGSFHKDNTFLTYTLLLCLQRNYKYLDLTAAQLIHMKFRLRKCRQFLQHHDQWLGQLKIEELTSGSMPFITDDFKDKDNLEHLHRLGWKVQDVTGDGNCGFYAMLLGLPNIGIHVFDVTKDNYKEMVFQFRNCLRAHSTYMLKSIYPPKSRDPMLLRWTLTGESTNEDIDGLSAPLAPTTFRRPEDYFSPRLKKQTEYHMNPGWAPHVLASKYKLRVIVYFLIETKKGRSLSIVSFEYANDCHLSEKEPHVKVEQEYIDTITNFEEKRISDLEFKRIPTIEILYQTGFTEDCPQHFQYLQRILCAGSQEPPAPSPTTLGEYLANQYNSLNSIEPTNTTRHVTDDLMDVDPRVERDAASIIHDASERTNPATSTRADALDNLPPSVPKRSKRSTKIPVKVAKKPATKPIRETRTSLALQRVCIQQHFDLQVTNGATKPIRMRYDSKNNCYYVMVPGEHTSTRQIVDSNMLNNYDPFLVESATKHANIWVGASIASPRDQCVGTGDAPVELCTEVKSPYQQLNQPFCLCYSMANALFHAGYTREAEDMFNAAPRIALLHFEKQISELLSFMQNLMPVIGFPTVFNLRLSSGNRKKRTLTWETLFKDRTEFPTLVIPKFPDGRRDHAFCVMDDLIFDSTTPRALKLCMESVRWLCREQEPTIDVAYRFMTKYSPPGVAKKHKTKGEYKHKPQNHWQHD